MLAKALPQKTLERHAAASAKVIISSFFLLNFMTELSAHI